MAYVTGRWAVVLILCTAVPTAVTHLLDGARLSTTLWRTAIAALGSFGLGIVLEWYVMGIYHQGRKPGAKGQRLDIKVGPTDQEQATVAGDPPMDAPRVNG